MKTPLVSPASVVIGATSGTNNKFYIDEFAIFNKAFTTQDAFNITNLYKAGITSSKSAKDGASATINLTATYGTSASSKVNIALMDEEKSYPTALYTDQIQLMTKESVTYVKAVKIVDSDITSSVNVFSSNISEQYVDGVKLLHNDKVLVLTQTSTSGLYTASITADSANIKLTGPTSLSSSNVFYVTDGAMFGQDYISMDLFSGQLLPNIEVDNAKIKYVQYTSNE